jgi:integrase
MANQLIIYREQETAVSTANNGLALAGHAANQAAANSVFADYLSRRADNTIRTQAAALALFADYLTAAGVEGIDGDCLQHDPDCWAGVTWGLVEGFVKWMLTQGYSVASVNNRLSTVKMYAKLATKAGAITPHDLALIKTVSGYVGKEAKRINERRPVTRIGAKKVDHIALTPEQARLLTDRASYEGPQGARDALLMSMLLEHGLRVGEVEGLRVADFDLKRQEMRFYRPKVDKVQTHQLTENTAKTLRGYLKLYPSALVLKDGRLLLGSTRDGELTAQPLSGRGISKRVRYLGRTMLGIDNLSPHDCRHHWATDAARNGTDPFRLQEAGGWSSLAMPRRYVEDAKIANQGIKLSSKV